MDFGNILYIIALLAYFIYQATRGKKKNDPKPFEDTTQRPTSVGDSFDELLREIRNQQKSPEPKATKEPPTTSATRPQTIQKETRPQFQPITSPKAKPSRFEAKEKKDDEIQYYKGAFESIDPKSVKSSAGIPDIPGLSARKEDLRRRSQGRVNSFSRLLRNKNEVRKAVVLREILDRKF